MNELIAFGLSLWGFFYIIPIIICIVFFMVAKFGFKKTIYTDYWILLSWVVPPGIWFALLASGWTICAKSLSNLSEILILAIISGIVILGYYILQCRKQPIRMKSYMVFAALTFIAISIGLLFPTLPE
ncbi:MAG: hypothetical protein MST10_04695 [Lentisphaeria bacterium]|nr:hypothetical protein [Lentisphaeria bacterium]